MDEHPVEHADRLLGVVDRDVDVHAEDQLAPRDVLELVDERAVAVAGRDALLFEQAERVRARRAHPQSRLPRDVRHGCPQPVQLGRHLADVAADGRRDLEHRLHELRVQLVLEV